MKKIRLIFGSPKPKQVRSYVEDDLKRAVDAFSQAEGMTSSQGQRRLMISGLRAEGWEVEEVPA